MSWLVGNLHRLVSTFPVSRSISNSCEYFSQQIKIDKLWNNIKVVPFHPHYQTFVKKLYASFTAKPYHEQKGMKCVHNKKSWSFYPVTTIFSHSPEIITKSALSYIYYHRHCYFCIEWLSYWWSHLHYLWKVVNFREHWMVKLHTLEALHIYFQFICILYSYWQLLRLKKNKKLPLANRKW